MFYQNTLKSLAFLACLESGLCAQEAPEFADEMPEEGAWEESTGEAALKGAAGSDLTVFPDDFMPPDPAQVSHESPQNAAAPTKDPSQKVTEDPFDSGAPSEKASQDMAIGAALPQVAILNIKKNRDPKKQDEKKDDPALILKNHQTAPHRALQSTSPFFNQISSLVLIYPR